jgi:hypothetical protein
MIPSSAQHPLLYRLVTAHYLFSAVSFLIVALMLLFSANDMLGHYFQPKLLAITHMAALGWGTSIIFGACYQLLPVILETELYSYKMGLIGLLLFVTGLVLFVFSLWHFVTSIYMQCGSILLVTSILLFSLNVFYTAKKIKRYDIYQEFIITACFWLTTTAILGTLLVFNFSYAFLQKDHLLFLKLHAHMGLGGWFLMLIIGVSSKLIPMFLVSTRQKPIFLTYSYYFINIGLLFFLIDTYFYGLNVKTYLAASFIVFGIINWLIFISLCFTSRIRKSIDLPIKHTLLSFLLLGVAVFVIPFIIFYQLKADPQAIRYTTLYGSLLFLGWISSLILGQTFKTLPFIVWIKHYQHLAGTATIPMPADLYSKKVLYTQYVMFLIFILSFYAGMLLKYKVLIYLGLSSFFLVAIFYLINVWIVFLHKPNLISDESA